MLTPQRIDAAELLDEHDAPREDVERSLRDLRRFNRYFGGAAVYRRLLWHMAGNEPSAIVDIATGTGDVLELLPDDWLRVGVDFKIEHLLYMRKRSRVYRVVGEALRLPFRNRAVDIVTSAHFFHHLSPEQNVDMLREALRVARRGVIVNDTLRHYVPLLVVRLLAILRLIGRITRNDAPASILRGYTLGEARHIAAQLHASRVDVVRAWPFRFGILLWKDGTAGFQPAGAQAPSLRRQAAGGPAAKDGGATKKADVAIIGAGPAGSTLAALLAQRGCSVSLFDRDSFPRDKLCGEFLSYDALPVLERFDIRLDGAPAIDRCCVFSHRQVYEFGFPDGARGVSRLLLDDLLLRNAIAAGAETHQPSTITFVSRDRVQTDDRELAARVVVGAWGRWGRFDTQLGRGFIRDRSHRNFGFKRHYVGGRRAGGGGHEAIELYSFDRGYLGVSAIENGQTNICGLVHASRLAGHKGRWESFVDEIRREEPRLDAMYARYEPAQDGFLSSEPVIFRARSAVVEGIFMIGDASGIIDPLTGSGMAMAIQSALLAAPFVLEALNGKRDEAERGYRRRHHDFFASRIRWSRRVAYLLSRPALLDAALMAVRSHAVGPFLLGHTRGTREVIARLADAWFS